ncbi:MAG: D-sedoheptulose 7-phosphate isomerase [Candidatus Cloacimonetes bacterium]|nr:D-sedoheptulose 7-phosphate isomerase [Candidatus Cloacimonadota bacterium]MBL7085759.1 D-sedoheptulose 7-phosphate isomerase [Candidatus Cloacimonadota bacterium]
MKNIIQKCLYEHIKVIKSISNFSEQIIITANEITNTLQNNGKIMLCGNGGSAADAQHIAAEFVVRFRSNFVRKSLPALSLTTDTSIITACSNDFGFDNIFSRQIESLGNKGDFLIGISTSGNSINVFKAFEVAKKKGIKTFLLSGKDGGKIKKIADNFIIIRHNETARIQEAHITIGHILCQLVEEEYVKYLAINKTN